MFYHAKNAVLQLGSTDMDYITFGHGAKTLIMIPGLGDGLKTVKGTALFFAHLYREYAKYYTVYVFSRKNHLKEGYCTKDMARDLKAAMDILGIREADIIGVSQGGMIAQHLALDYPAAVNKLVLVVSLARQTKVIQNLIGSWMKMAEEKDYKSLFIDMMEHMYSEHYLHNKRGLYPILSKVGKPDSFDRFLIMADACLTHDAWQELPKITAPTFVIGGDNDRVVGQEAFGELAGRIPGCRSHLYKDFGHGLYDEAKDFNRLVLDFLLQ